MNLQQVVASGNRSCAVDIRQAEGVAAEIDQVAEEVAVAMVYNGVSHAVMMATPMDLDDFGVGFSLTESIVDTAEQIRDLGIQRSDAGIEIQMQVASAAFARLKQRRRQLSGRTGCGLCGLESLQSVRPVLPQLRPVALPNFQVLAEAAEEMSNRQQLQALCGGVHAAALVSADGQILVLREDVGRHNALDKVLGRLPVNWTRRSGRSVLPWFPAVPAMKW